MKKEYNTPELEVVTFESEDILGTTSDITLPYDPNKGGDGQL